MPLREHLAELRNRILLSALGMAVGAVGGWFLFTPTFETLQRPLLAAAAKDNALVAVNFSGIASALDLRLKVALFLGMIISSPWWLYQLWAYIAPGLTGKEKRYTVGFVASAVPLFLAGIAVAWAMFPRAVTLLADFRPNGSEQLLDAELYLTFAMRLLVAFGLAFVFPVVMVALTWVGIVPWRVWLKGWRWAVLLIFVFTAAMTPTPDAITMTVMAIPMCALYFGAIGIGALRAKPRAKGEE
ncbi:twin-arginine translocase subunit TatC [Demequina lutea]|uniref:Sec-independent protein translocase protein TatC n=1 Tax=Demequina lutea TaxID=431489 RepID=A0A7Y9ZDL2_9MICO|nr:twin-arginine translocase subunit TatC [Demequina lutea]NYI41396.1 sec-independent protein translocase protein TatC [Demequina lutea]